MMPLGLCRTADQRVPLPYFPDGPVGGVAAQETGCTAEPGLAFLRTLRSARRAVHLPLSPPSRALVWGCAPPPPAEAAAASLAQAPRCGGLRHGPQRCPCANPRSPWMLLPDVVTLGI